MDSAPRPETAPGGPAGAPPAGDFIDLRVRASLAKEFDEAFRGSLTTPIAQLQQSSEKIAERAGALRTKRAQLWKRHAAQRAEIERLREKVNLPFREMATVSSLLADIDKTKAADATLRAQLREVAPVLHDVTADRERSLRAAHSDLTALNAERDKLHLLAQQAERAIRDTRRRNERLAAEIEAVREDQRLATAELSARERQVADLERCLQRYSTRLGSA
eukprot:gnl/Chilomastix_cuspidata/3715.p3 GENE.gnl/Chilomastix_cuspidata/3715~~gnl/Chilomastix_cuspidata/3715.p3  ORF type:complete len:220 (-),score=86.65 gnl/Chilomastix_cuspidata/3715:662-1321(-)